jgi:hypothetical protein
MPLFEKALHVMPDPVTRRTTKNGTQALFARCLEPVALVRIGILNKPTGLFAHFVENGGKAWIVFNRIMQMGCS